MSDSDKTEFIISINRINIVRAKITTITFVILEAMVLLIHIEQTEKTFLTCLTSIMDPCIS